MSNEQVNGIDTATKKAADERPPNRQYCDTCKFSQFILGADALLMTCRRNPPQAIGNVQPVQQGGQVVPQWFTQTVWPAVGREDWCGAHEPDPKGVRTPVAANDSKLIQPS